MKKSSEKRLAKAARAVASVIPHGRRASPPTTGRPTESTRLRRSGGSGVLVVEDDPDLQWSLARMLTVQGRRVVGTSSGEGALALVAQWPVDLVLVDDGLPGISGIEVARKLRAMHPSIPVVLMTGDETPELRVAAKLAGVMACLTKPFRSEAIAELLQRVAQMPIRPSLVPAE